MRTRRMNKYDFKHQGQIDFDEFCVMMGPDVAPVRLLSLDMLCILSVLWLHALPLPRWFLRQQWCALDRMCFRVHDCHPLMPLTTGSGCWQGLNRSLSAELELRTVFDFFDSDRSGVITPQQLKEVTAPTSRMTRWCDVGLARGSAEQPQRGGCVC